MSQVFVLGAGFTKAFFPKSPLAKDDFGTARLLREFRDRRWALARLKEERRRSGGNTINLERLMSRVQGLPHDSDDDRLEGALLFSRLKRELLDRIQAAGDPIVDREQLPPFFGRIAAFILRKNVTVITFNYDEFLDAALVAQSDPRRASRSWNAYTGYGFPFRNVLQHGGTSEGAARPAAEVLKLHGSIGWRTVRGSRKSALTVGSLVRFQPWEFGTPPPGRFEQERRALAMAEPLVDEAPFIVPPVMEKHLASESLLSLIWARALDALKAADEVTFVGFSMPITDFAARALFFEGLRRTGDRGKPRIEVIDHPGAKKQTLRNRYRYALGRSAKSIDFVFDGASKWAESLQLPP